MNKRILFILPLLLAACTLPESPGTLWQITGSSPRYADLAERGQVHYLRSTSPSGELVAGHTYPCGYALQNGASGPPANEPMCQFAVLSPTDHIPDALKEQGLTHALAFPTASIGNTPTAYLKKVGEEWQGFLYGDPHDPEIGADGTMTLRRWK